MADPVATTTHGWSSLTIVKPGFAPPEHLDYFVDVEPVVKASLREKLEKKGSSSTALSFRFIPAPGSTKNDGFVAANMGRLPAIGRSC